MRVRVRKLLFWGFVLMLALIAGALGFAYSYVTDSATLAALIRREAPRFLPGTVLQMNRVQWRPFLGQVTLEHTYLWQSVDGRPFNTARVAWLNVRCDLKALTKGRLVPTEISIAQPVLRLCKRRDGGWNVQGMIADPWPAPPLPREPVILIKNGTLELCNGEEEVPAMVLRDVELTLTPQGEVGGPIRFEGAARGGPFDLLHLEGVYDRRTGRLDLTRGDVTRLELSDSFRHCLPDVVQNRFAALGLSGGEVNLVLKSLTFDPRSPEPLRCATGIHLRGATLDRPELPFPLTGMAAVARLEGDTMIVEHAEGRNGKTFIQVQGQFNASDPQHGPLDLSVEVTDLELDERLKRVTPPEFAPFWSQFQPEGWINAGLKLKRAERADPMAFALTVHCLDVRALYELFPYPFQHVQGTLVWQGPTLTADLRTLVGGEWVTCTGTIEHPGPDAVVDLDFAGRAFPLDKALIRALPPEFRTVVSDFQPTGSVQGVVHLTRQPPRTPLDPPVGQVRVHAKLDLNEGCSIRWSGLPYLIRDLTGHLELKPESWSFSNMKGHNGNAQISANGEVMLEGARQTQVRIDITAEHLPFEQQLREALPEQWQASWATLNPSGISRVEARITAQEGEEPHYHFKIVPEPEQTRIQLMLTPVEGTPSAGRTITLPPMENIAGTFIYDDGTITMEDVSCVFREAPVRFESGTVVVQHNGGFRLIVKDLLVTKLRLDPELRGIMPPVMAQFAQRLDDGKTFRIRSDLGIGWTGQRGVPARCEWQNAIVVFTGNTIKSGLPLEQLQGQIDHVWGWSDGRSIEANGAVDLDSVRLMGLQITGLRTPLIVKDGQAHLSNFEAQVLGGTIFGEAHLSLEETPRYNAVLKLFGADLEHYTRTLPGKQSLRGLVSGQVKIEGRGNDLRTCLGTAEASVTNGDLGQLPFALQLLKALSLRQPTKTAFDSAEVRATIADGRATFDRITFRGDAFSLTGDGSIEFQGDREINLRLTPVYGRDERRIPIVGDAVREASSRVIDVHVTGPLSAPSIRAEPFPTVLAPAGEVVRRMGERRAERDRSGTPGRDRSGTPGRR